MCARCNLPKSRLHYTFEQWKQKGAGSRLCRNCDKRRCYTCNYLKDCTSFARGTWNLSDNDLNFICTKCKLGQKQKGVWTCTVKSCRIAKPKSEFTVAISKHGDPPSPAYRKVCDTCHKKRAADEYAKAVASASQVQKLRRR